MENDKKNMTKRILQFLLALGRKCRILAYPITFIVVVFLAIYHTIKRVFVESTYRRLRAGLIGGMCAAVILGAAIVLPILANETEEEPTTEVVTEEELEPTQTPEMTVEPIVTEIPDTPEPEEEMEEEQDGKKEEEELTEELSSESSEQDKKDEYQLPVITPEETQGQENSTDPDNAGNTPKIKKMAAEKLPQPKGEVTKKGEGVHTYPLSEPIEIAISASRTDGKSGIEYQWYMSNSDREKGEKIPGAKARLETYEIPKDTDAGTYYYTCEIISVDNDGVDLPSEAVPVGPIKVTIDKGVPTKSDFDQSSINAIKKEYLYTGEYINPTITTKCEGMGDAYIVLENGNRPRAEIGSELPIYLYVKEGKNYFGAPKIDLERTISIRYLDSPRNPYTICNATTGKVVGVKEWYTAPVSIKPASGYLIGTTDDSFETELVYDSEGRDQGPKKPVIYLRRISDNAITDAISMTDRFNIDTVAPTASITPKDQNISNEELEFQLEASDDTSGLANRYYALSTTIAEAEKVAASSWKIWDEEPFKIDTEGTYYLHARVVDHAGNVSYDTVGPVMIDQQDPVITCNNKLLGEDKTYIADKKTVVISDKNLKRVIVTKGMETVDDKSGSDTANGSVQILLAGPADKGAPDVTYTINATDRAGNETTTMVTLKNPFLDVEVDEVTFGNGESAQTLTYGYDSVDPKEVVLRQSSDGEKVIVDSLEIEDVGNGAEAFELVQNNRIRPKQGLHAGSYEALIRVNYNGEAESTRTFRCSLEVEQAEMQVRIKEQTVYYHTCPDFLKSKDLEQVFEFTEFKNRDTVKTLKDDPEFEWPSFYYMDDDGEKQPFDENTRVMESMKLMAEYGQSRDYVFAFVAGNVNMVRRPLRQGYVIIGDRVDGYEWYISPTVTIKAANGYHISRTEDPSSFYSDLTITVTGPTIGVHEPEEFYVMNDDTGEISKLHSEDIKIDDTAPYLRAGEGITVSNNLFDSFMNDITFGLFFNDTKDVTITATDGESGLASIEYCVTGRSLGRDDMDQLTWQEYPYETGFSISPEEYGRAVIYAKITNKAGLVTYISSNGMLFDNKQPDISKVENGKEQVIIDEKEYITEELNLKVSDRNLIMAKLFDGTNTAATGSALQIVGDEDSVKEATKTIYCPKSGSKTYTVVASDEAGNYSEREFTVTKPVYDIKVNTLKIKSEEYGYEKTPQVAVTWENGETANADATVVDVILDNTRHFEVQQIEGRFWIAAKQDLECGTYLTGVTLVYNDDKRATTTCSFVVEKATLTATYTGDDLYYHEKIKDSSVEVTGFVKHNGELETPETAAGYKEPVIVEDGYAKKTCELTPSGGKADNYKFVYRPGLLLVERRYATTGKDGQYYIDGNISDSGWYTSDIVIRPKDGYALLLNETDEEQQESIVLSKDTDRGEKDFYIINTRTEEIYHPSTLYYKKDTVPPAIKGIEDGVTYEANTKEVTVEDDYLTSVTVNGEARPVEHGGTKFTLTAEQETMVYVVVATDCAGNVTSKAIVMNQLESLSPDPGTDPEENYVDDVNVTPLPTATPKEDDSDDTRSGTVKKLVKVVQGAPNTSMTTSTSELKTSVLTSGEQQAVDTGSNANIELRIKNIDSSVPQGDKELIIANLNGYSVGEYLDITLWKKVGSSSQKKVTNTNKPIVITVSVPESLRKVSREFVVLRVHGGSVSVLSDRDSAANTVTFATDKFSTYVLAYKQGSGNQSYGNVSISGGSNGSTGSSTYYDVSPETGDKAPIVPVSIAFVISLAGILTTLTIRRRTR